MKPSELAKLEAVVALQREQVLARLQPLAKAESALHSRLIELSDAAKTLAVSENLSDMRLIGQDGVWLRWVFQSRAALLREAAEIRARKVDILADAQRSTARHLAVQKIRKKAERRQARRLQDPS